MKLPEILNILKKIDFPKNAISQDDFEYQKYELLGDSLIKTYVIEGMFHLEMARDIWREGGPITSNRNLEVIFDYLNLNEIHFNTKVPNGKKKADVIEMVVGCAYSKFGREYASEVMSYLFDMDIYESLLRHKSRATITGNFNTAWRKKFDKTNPNFLFDRDGDTTYAKLMIGENLIMEMKPSRKSWFELDQDMKLKFVEKARREGIFC